MRLLILPATLAAVTLAIVGQQPTTPTASNASTQTSTKKAVTPSANCPDIDELRKNVAQLSGENQRLKKRVAELERDRSVATILQHLEKEQQRGEALQHHL